MTWGVHGCPFAFALFVLIVGFIVVRMCTMRNYWGPRRHWSDDAESILRRRLANSEITEEEFQKLRDALKK